MKKTIAVIDDEADILELVSLHLERAGFAVSCHLNAESFMRSLEKKIPDLILLDLMLPDADGLDVCRQLLKNDSFSSVPIIMLTAKGEETDKVVGLELGADDYVTKPFSPKELVARIKAVLRRKETALEPDSIQIGGILDIDLKKFTVRIAGKPAELTSTEFKILKLLAARKGWVFSRSQILESLWGHEKIVLDRTVDVHIRNMRSKLGKAGSLIKNIRGMGYKIEE